MPDNFADMLKQVWQMAKNRTPTPDEILQEFRRQTETLTLADTSSLEERGLLYYSRNTEELDSIICGFWAAGNA